MVTVSCHRWLRLLLRRCARRAAAPRWLRCSAFSSPLPDSSKMLHRPYRLLLHGPWDEPGGQV